MLYLHVPFCRQACHYCNFHFSTSMKYENEMIEAMIKELEYRKDYLEDKKLSSIYFGGGTPSILNSDLLSRLFEGIRKNFEILGDAEVTFEANPEDITIEKLEFWHSIGINRLSIGIQSFAQADLDWMNRIHSIEQSDHALDLVDKFGKLDYSMDLIFGSETTSDEIWLNNLQRTIKRRPSHISCYALTIEENTPLHHFVTKGKKKESPQEKIKTQFYQARKILIEAGYDHYEISNYSLPGKNAVHNGNYWKSKPYLGIGPAAHSYNRKTRSWNFANNATYIKSISENKTAEVSEELSEQDQYNEFVMTRLRTKWGVNKNELLTHFSNKFTEHFLQEVQASIQEGYITEVINAEGESTFALSEKSLIIADTISSDLFY